MQEQNAYETQGTLYLVDTMHGDRGLIGLSFEDHEELISGGFRDEEVYLTVGRAVRGAAYAQRAPECRTRAGLCTMEMEGLPKFQLALDTHAAEELSTRGFEDGDEVSLTIEHSPYRVPSKPFEIDDLRLDLEMPR